MRQLQLNHVRCAAALLLVAILTPTATAATFVVSSTVDNAIAPNLRRAISDANANPGLDTVVFDFPGSPVTLTFSSPLPDIIESVVIDGTDPNGCLAGGAPRIQLDGIGLGPNANGLAARGTAVQPIGVTIKGLAVYRFPGTGILLEYNTNSVIVGNHVGINAAGNFPLPNGAGLVLDNCDDVIVGGTAPCQRNVMSGNQRGGLEIYQGSGHRVINNLVGLSANGQWAVPNQVGVALHFGQQCQIGSLLQGQGNVISRNLQEGVLVTGGLGVPMGSRIEGNFIGTLAGGSFPAPNGGDGIHFLGGPTRNHVRGNVIAHNGGSGVMVLEGIDNEIVENSIFSNTLLGIDISPRFAPNPNDPCDADEGPNRQQNFPMVASALSSASSVQIDGVLDSESGKTYRLDFYWNPACDGFGFGEGRHYIGQTTVTNGIAGQCVTPFSVSFPVPVPPGVVVTATATHPEGSTSEFSPCAPVLASGSNIVHHAGLPHQGGSGVPVPCPEGWSGGNPCDLTVPGNAASRTASVRIGLGRVTGWQGDLQDVLLRDFGDSLKLEFEGEDGEPVPPPEELEAAKELWAEANIPTRSPSIVLAAITNGSMFLQFTLMDAQDNEMYTGHPQSSVFHLTLNSSNDVVDISQAGYLQLPNGERVFRLEFRNPLLLAVPAVQGRFATRAIIAVLRKTSPAAGQSLPPPATITSARLTFRRESPTAGTPLSFRIGEELLQQFGQLHGSLNNSTMAGWHWSQSGTGDPARVTFPASTIYAGFPHDASGALTEGGVMLRLDQARYISVDLDWDLASSSTPFFAAAGSPVMGLPYFKFKVGTNHFLPPHPDALVIQRGEGIWSIAPDFGTSGTISNRYEMYVSGVLAGRLDTSTGVVAQARSAPIRVAHSTSVSPAGAAGFHLRWREAAIITLPETPGLPGVPGTGGTFVADELRIIPLNPASPLRTFTRIDISGAGLPWLEITGEDWRSSRVGRVMVQKVRDGVELTAPTEAGRPYQLEFTPSLNAREWQIIDSFIGDGSVRRWKPPGPPIRPPGPPTIPGFYRLGGF